MSGPPAGARSAKAGAAAHVVVIGSVNMDLVVRAERLPRPGETFRGDDFAISPGGKGANQAVAVAQLGGRSTLIARVGDDAFGAQLRAGLDDFGVDTTHVTTTADCPSGVAVISVDRRGENAITIVSGANAALLPEDIRQLESLIARADALLLQLEIPTETVVAAVELARKHRVFTVLDTAPVPPQGLPGELFSVDVISPNQSEAEQLTGISVTDAGDARRAADELLRRGAHWAVMKLGADGALLVGQGQCHHVRPPQVTVVDATAAGDAFTAGLALAWCEGKPPVDAVRFGCGAGALATTSLGAQQAMPTRERVEEILAKSWGR